MDSMIDKIINLRSYAKINLYLDINKKLENGYHNIETIIQTINLYDDISLKKINDPYIYIECNNPEVPIGKDSMLYRAIEMLLTNEEKGLAVSIYKRIPLAAGLGGGSSNVATILMGICRLFCLELSLSQLMDLGAQLGMDIPFFMVRGTVYAKGKGEIIFPLKSISPPIPLLLINPGIKISTKWAYHLFDEEANKADFHSNKTGFTIDYLINKNKTIKPSEIYKNVYNSFDSIISKEYSIIGHIKNHLKDIGAIIVSISGSGPTVYGIFENKNQADWAYKKIKDKYPFVYNTSTVRARNIFD